MRSRLLPILTLLALTAFPAAAHNRTSSAPNNTLPYSIDIEPEIVFPAIIADAPDTLPVFTRSRKLASGFFARAAQPNIQRTLDLGQETRLGDDSLHARYYNPNLGRFLSVDPKLSVGKAMFSPQRWNRYSYVSNNPIGRLDPDGREQVTFGDKRTEMLFTQLERSAKVRATLDRYRGVGTPDLRISRGDAGKDIDGKTSASGVFKPKFSANYNVDQIVASGAKQDESSLLPVTGKFLSGSKLESAELIISDTVRQGSGKEKDVALHELGHAEGAAADPDRYLALGADDVIKPNGKLLPHDDRPLEEEANKYRDTVK